MTLSRTGCSVSTLLLLALLATPASLAAAGRRESERWVALRVSLSGRVIVLQALGGGCGRDPRATAQETRSTVTINVTQAVPNDPDVACPAIARVDTLRVRLASPINGRALVGQSLRTVTALPTERRTMPRMIGLRVVDARFSLRAQHFDPRGVRSGTVRRQQPAPGTAVPAGRLPVALSSARTLP